MPNTPSQASATTALPLVPLTPDEIPLGDALPWAIVDQTGEPLLAEGDMVPTQAGRDWLFTSFAPHRMANLGEDDAALADIAPSPAPATGEPTSAAGMPPAQYALTDLNLRPGDWLQIQLPPGAGSQRVRTRVIGHAPNQMLFVTVPTGRTAPPALQASERLELWTFSEEDIYHFVCTVERAERAPFDYVILSAPAQIRRKVLRRSQRVSAKRVASVVAGEASHLALLQDVSAEGVSLLADTPLGAPGERMQLAFRVRVGEIDMPIEATGMIRGVQQGDDGSYLHGIELPMLKPSHYAALKCYVYERLLALGGA
ncbi:flagellar brake protein [Pandoraea horticolens]|uniref:Flagellar brake protein n=1 Tax=Pandoraea horticolens TaxID=2508298 RepID=A0A5E4VJ75_9BURK|nr:flagellar brake protein [Pandoraea horticolens]VVE11459.1 flagellar brake protein [Pandoraea horticolens]